MKRKQFARSIHIVWPADMHANIMVWWLFLRKDFTRKDVTWNYCARGLAKRIKEVVQQLDSEDKLD